MSNVNSSTVSNANLFNLPDTGESAGAGKAKSETTVAPGIHSRFLTPDVGKGNGAQSGGQANASASMSLSAFMTGGGKVDTEVLLVQVAVAMRDTEATSQKAKVNTDQETKRLQSQEKKEKLEEAQKKMDEAEAKKKSGSLLDKIKLAFEWLGAIIAVATAAILIATGVGTAMGIALMAAAAVAVVMAIDSTVQAATGMGIAGNLHMAVEKAKNELGLNAPPKTEEKMKEEAAKADMGFRIAMAVVGIALAVATGGKSLVNGVKTMASAVSNAAQNVISGAGIAQRIATSASSAAAKIADLASDVAGAARNIGQTAASAAAKVADAASDAFGAVKNIGKSASDSAKVLAKFAQMRNLSPEETLQVLQTSAKGLQMLDTGGQIASTGLDVAAGATRYQATSASAEAKQKAAEAKLDQAMMEMLDDAIDQALMRLKAGGDRFSAMLDAIMEGVQDRGNTLARAQFRG